MRLYYREIRVKNVFHLEHNGPMIIIANHPNTLMDAWLIAQSSKVQIHYLAKGTFFNTKFKRWLLGSLGMIPINRSQDGNTNGVSNTDSFEACYKVLEAGKTLVIFPEGNSVMERQLRQLKSGTARIALETLNRNNGNLNLLIVPVGLFYSQANRFRSSVFVNFGKGVAVNDFLNSYKENSIQASRDLTLKFRKMLEEVLILSASKEQEALVDTICELLLSESDQINVEYKARLILEFHRRLEEIQLVEPEKMPEIQQLVNTIKWQSEQMAIRADILENGFRSKMFIYEMFVSLFILLIGFPMFIFGLVHSIVPFKLTEFLTPRLVKNVEYYAPIAILLGLVFYPINYILLMNFADRFLAFNLAIKITYFLLMPFTGMFAFHFAKFLGIFSFRLRFIFTRLNKKEAIEKLKENKEKLKEMINLND